MKIELARDELAATIRGEDIGCPSVSAAETWLARVQTWSENIKMALEADSVAAPGLPGERWLLYGRSADSLRALPDGSILCSLCKKCIAPLQQCKRGPSNAPALCIPCFPVRTACGVALSHKL